MRPSVETSRALCGPQGTGLEARPLTTECPSLVSDHGGGGTPGPIPNPEVKPPSADGTAEWSVGEQDVADQRGAFACLEGPVTRVVAGPSCVWLGAAKPTVA